MPPPPLADGKFFCRLEDRWAGGWPPPSDGSGLSGSEKESKKKVVNFLRP
jgi:hypothetical protein